MAIDSEVRKFLGVNLLVLFMRQKEQIHLYELLVADNQKRSAWIRSQARQCTQEIYLEKPCSSAQGNRLSIWKIPARAPTADPSPDFQVSLSTSEELLLRLRKKHPFPDISLFFRGLALPLKNTLPPPLSEPQGRPAAFCHSTPSQPWPCCMIKAQTEMDNREKN